MRVHELAKELRITSKDLLLRLKDRHIEAKNHMTSLDEDVVKLFLEERAQSKTAVSGVFVKRPDAEKIAAKEKRPKEKTSVPALQEAALPGSPVLAAPQVLEEAALKPLETCVPLSVKELSSQIGIKSGDLIKYLIQKFKIFANINQSLNEELVSGILRNYGYQLVKPSEQLRRAEQGPGDVSKLKPRPPIVTFMGHVDHGKTSLLDAIRRTKIAESEYGGITQHIGAYQVKHAKGMITFLDTPGHEAFTAMRSRGAQVTDIVVLVVAADDGVMPQTIEALDHAKAAGVSIIVAMNKIDKPQADLDKLKRQLNELGLIPEDWGGKTITVGVSAKTGEGIDTLLEMILLESEMLELKASFEEAARGVVVEAKLSRGRGPVATVLVELGVLKTGDFIVAGHQSGHIRAMSNSLRQAVSQAGPSMPVEVTGLSGVPEAGDTFLVVDDEKKAKAIMEQRQQEFRRQRLDPALRRHHLHLEDLYQEIKEHGVKELHIILKADTQGSLEAIEDSLNKIGTSEVKIMVMHKAVGLINTSDVVLAAASDAIIIGFHVEPDDLAKEMSRKEEIDIRCYRVIYEIVNDMKAALEGMLAPRLKKVFLGRAEVRKVFRVSKSGIVAGSLVKKGKIIRGADIVLLRNGEAVHEGKIAALKRFKDDVREVQEGFECGISLVNFEDIQEGDCIDAFIVEQIARKLE